MDLERGEEIKRFPVDSAGHAHLLSQRFHQEWQRDWPCDATATARVFAFARVSGTRCQFQLRASGEKMRCYRRLTIRHSAPHKNLLLPKACPLLDRLGSGFAQNHERQAIRNCRSQCHHQATDRQRRSISKSRVLRLLQSMATRVIPSDFI